MNVIAAAPGWRDLTVWAMPPAAYALASDTLIGVVRVWVIARHQELNAALAPGEVTVLAVAGGLVLWLLRLSVAPASTLAGFRAWVHPHRSRPRLLQGEEPVVRQVRPGAAVPYLQYRARRLNPQVTETGDIMDQLWGEDDEADAA